MDEKGKNVHSLYLEQRSKGLITGVTEVKAFDEMSILLITGLGTMLIKGSQLHVGRLELKKGEAEVEGKIDSIVYTQKNSRKKKDSLLKRLFQ